MSLVPGKGVYMKTIFNRTNRGKFTLYMLFSLAMLSFVVLLLCQMLFHVDVSLLALICPLMGMMFFGGLIIQMRSGPPW